MSEVPLYTLNPKHETPNLERNAVKEDRFRVGRDRLK